MSGDVVLDEVKRMFITLREDHKSLCGRVENMQASLDAVIRLEQQQINTNQAVSRMGKHIDSVELDLKRTREELVNLKTNDLTDMKISSARLVTKVSLLGGSGGAGVAAVLAAVMKVAGVI